jgi:murein DD-endopeptidase MepM/ murein hydrolase activator NlpD
MKITLFLFTIFISFATLHANVKKKIEQQSSYLKSKGRIEKKISQKLNVLADEILKQMKDLDSLKNQIDNLDKSIKESETEMKNSHEALNKLLDSNKKLFVQKKSLEKKIVDILAKDFSYYLITNKNIAKTQDSIVADEVIKKMDIVLRNEFGKLSLSYKEINNKIEKKQKETESIQEEIQRYKKKKEDLLALKKQRELAIKKLNSEKLNYKKRLQRIKREKISIRATLEKLKILKKAQNLKAQREAELRKRAQKVGNSKLNVRQIGSSYQSSKVKRYRGKKTIAPLESFTVKRKFGNYTDPIYNMKIFNDSVILSSKIRNAKVKNILNGKVVFAKDTAVLDKVIIIENSNGIHTIYAHLSKIAPTVRVGKKIKKGYVIGRVDRDLTFEVTQKNYHINPLQLIRLN